MAVIQEETEVTWQIKKLIANGRIAGKEVTWLPTGPILLATKL